MPNIASQSMTYNANIFVDVTIKFKDLMQDKEEMKHKNIRIGSIPLMLHSSGCYLKNKKIDDY